MTTHMLEILFATTAFALAATATLGAAFVALEQRAMLRLPGFEPLKPGPPPRLHSCERIRRAPRTY